MKTILYLAMTANGFIAKENDNTDFVSEEEMRAFDAMSKKAGNIIIGSKTFEVLKKEKLFPYDERYNVVMSKKKIKNTWGEDEVWVTNASPREVIDELEAGGHKIAFIGGGSEIASSFMKAGVVDEVYLDVEPMIFGKGIPLLKPADFEIKLKLINTKKISENTVQLHYQVKK